MNLDLEFEGDRAFAIWNRISFGDFELKGRLELDPNLLEKVNHRRQLFLYHGEVALPRPQDN